MDVQTFSELPIASDVGGVSCPPSRAERQSYAAILGGGAEGAACKWRKIRKLVTDFCADYADASIWMGGTVVGKFLAALVLSVLCAFPGLTTVIKIDFSGAFTRSYAGGALYRDGAIYGGSFTFDTSAAANNATSNAIGTFARFNNVGSFQMATSEQGVFTGVVDVITNDLVSGVDNFRFFMNLGNGYTFALAYALLPSTAVVGASIPADLAILSGLPTGSIMDAQMRGNFGVASATARAVAVPEATTWAMLIAGFYLVGLAMRRTRFVASRLA